MNCSGAKLTTTGTALLCVLVKVARAVFFDKGFECAGEIWLHGAEIGGQLNCRGAKLTAATNALSCGGAKVAGDVFLSGGFSCPGRVDLSNVRLGGDLICEDATISSLSGGHLEVKGYFFWHRLEKAEASSLNLMGARVRAMYDDRASWPARGNLQVTELEVEELFPLLPDGLHETGRIAWLELQPETELAEPQPWMHMAALFEAKGHKRAAKRVVRQLKGHQSRANWGSRRYGWFGLRWDAMMAWLEEKPGRILWSLSLFVMLGSVFFWTMRAHFAPTNESAQRVAARPDGRADGPMAAYPKYNPVVYALENALPVVKLGQDDKWGPDAGHSSAGVYRALVWMRWFLILAGWAQGLILGAAVSARFRS